MTQQLHSRAMHAAFCSHALEKMEQVCSSPPTFSVRQYDERHATDERRDMVRLIMRVCDREGLLSATLHTAIACYDTCLADDRSATYARELVALTSLFIAIKLCEVQGSCAYMGLDDIVGVCKEEARLSVRTDDVRHVEQMILLHWTGCNLVVDSPHAVLKQLEQNLSLSAQCVRYAKAAIEESHLDHRILNSSAPVLACAAVIVSLRRDDLFRSFEPQREDIRTCVEYLSEQVRLQC